MPVAAIPGSPVLFMRFLALPLALFLAIPAAEAQPVTAQDVAAALRVPDLLEVMRDEGVDYGKDLAGELFPDGNSSRWQEMVAQIYGAPSVRAQFDDVFARQLDAAPQDVPAILAFFTGPLGKRIVGLEIDARRAMLDPAAEEAARLSWSGLEDRDRGRLRDLREFVEANNLIEENVAGTMNANLAFYHGMNDGGAFAGDRMDEEEIVAEVQAQEPQVRRETEDWLMPYLALAYQPLSDAELGDYIAFSQSQAGQTINAALFAAYGAVYTEISKELGRAAARVLAGQDI